MATGQPIYFLHIPKTAGTSTRRFLADAMGEDAVSPPMLWDTLLGGAPPDRGRWRVWIGHFQGLFPLWLGHWPFTFTFLRDPVARAVSHINHVQRSPEHPLHAEAKALSIAEYCASPRLARTLENFQARHLASLCFALDVLRPKLGQPHGALSVRLEDDLWALDRATDLLPNALRALDHLGVVGICEASGASMALLARTLGIAAPARDYRLNTAAAGQASVAALAAPDLAHLQQLTEVDRAVYDAACRRFRADCRAAGIAPTGLPPLPAWESGAVSLRIR